MDSDRHSTTVFAMVGKCLTKPVFMFGSGTTLSEYKRFIRYAAGFIKSDVHRPVVCFDGHRTHTSPQSLVEVRRYFRDCQQVSYSSPFNPVETLFSLMRRNFLKLMLMQTEVIERDKFLEMVRAAFDMVTPL